MANSELTITLDEKDYQRMQNILSGLDEVDQAKAIQSSLKEGMKILIAQGKTNLASRNKVVSGNLKKSFSISVNRKKAFSLGGFKRSSGKKEIGGGNHSYLVDKGTKNRYTKKGYYRGSVSKGRPNTGSEFWTDAVQTQGDAALNRLMDAIYESVDKIMANKK